MIPDPWTDRCPKGHTSLRMYRSTKKYWCEPCGTTYVGEPYDARDVDEFPVEGEHVSMEKTDRDAVLSRLVEVCDKPGRGWATSGDVDLSNKRAARFIIQLEKRGLVFHPGFLKAGKKAWQPTEAGRRRVRELNRGRVATDGGDDT